MTVHAGTVVGGRFRIERELGEGATGVVYEASQLKLDRRVALKVLRPELGRDPRGRARFEREARVASVLDHPQAVEIYDFGVDGDRIYLAMELLDGEPLRRRLPHLDGLTRILDVAFQVADILEAAHRIPLVHRDLKPENVFLEATDRARIVDFGLAFIHGTGSPANADAGPTSGRMTVEGVVTGTPAYLSPEQARGEEVGPPTDIYALGCMLYEMLTTRVPFSGSEVEILTRQMYAPPPRLEELRGGFVAPTALAELVASMLRKRADERPSAAEVRRSLAEIDPEVARSRGRGRDDSFLLGRAARMVAAPARVDPLPTPSVSIDVAILGRVSADLLVGLMSNGLSAFVVSEEQPLDGADAVYAPGAGVAEVATLGADGMPVVTDTDAGDMDRIGALLRAGAAEVLVRPVAVDDLARRLLRAVRKRRKA